MENAIEVVNRFYYVCNNKQGQVMRCNKERLSTPCWPQRLWKTPKTGKMLVLWILLVDRLRDLFMSIRRVANQVQH